MFFLYNRDMNKSQRIIISFFVGFLTGLLIVWVWNVYSSSQRFTPKTQKTIPSNVITKKTDTSTSTIENTDSSAVTPSTIIDVSDQSAGNTVKVSHITLANDGWIVVHEARGGFIANALGAARKDAGKYSDITISLMRNTEPKKEYWVVLYKDNGDRIFDLNTDFPVRDSKNNPIINSFYTQ